MIVNVQIFLTYFQKTNLINSIIPFNLSTDQNEIIIR